MIQLYLLWKLTSKIVDESPFLQKYISMLRKLGHFLLLKENCKIIEYKLMFLPILFDIPMILRTQTYYDLVITAFLST